MILGPARAKIHVYPNSDLLNLFKSTSNLPWIVIFGEKSQN